MLPPAIPTVVSLVLAPASLTLDLEGSPDVLSVTATWSDGTVSAVNATWNLVGASNVVALGASPASSVLVTPTAIGAVAVRAMFGGKMAQGTVTVGWEVPENPGLYYGIEIDGLGIGSDLDGPGVVEYTGAPGKTPRGVVQDPMF